MDTIHGFWAGALAVQRRVDLDRAAEAVGGWANLARSGVDDLMRIGVPQSVAREWLTAPPLVTRGHALTRACPGYPAALRGLRGAPPVLFVEGDPAVLDRLSVAVVGTRAASAHGSVAAHRIAHAVASAGMVVLSGLARGIDSAAHRSALSARGTTVAVVGHGLSHTAPPSNRHLRKEIVASGGLVISTWPDDTPPARWTFPARNRWIAALARRLVVIEAPERSGALITAEHMLDLGRDQDLYVVPGPVGAEGWRGSAALLALGVQPLSDLDAFVRDLVGDTQRVDTHPVWLAALFRGASVDEAARIGGSTALELLRRLVALELEGEVVRLPGGRYAPGGGLP